MKRRIIAIIICFTFTFSLASCGEKEKWISEDGLSNIFNEDESIFTDNVYIDESHIEEGYIGVKALEKEGLLLQIVYGDLKYNYRMDDADEISYIPLQMGSGLYTLRLLNNTVGDKYISSYEKSIDVILLDEFQPFLRPSIMVNYSDDSYSVAEAERLKEKASDELDYVKSIYKYIQKEVDYDNEFASSNPKMYYPDPDKTLYSGLGICFDYATLAAAMFRSQGIPTKVVTGYVSPNDLYHAWNLIYIQNKGWITVKIEVKGEEWNRIDITFADGGGNLDATYTDYLFY